MLVIRRKLLINFILLKAFRLPSSYGLIINGHTDLFNLDSPLEFLLISNRRVFPPAANCGLDSKSISTWLAIDIEYETGHMLSYLQLLLTPFICKPLPLH
jgi:hypothetical protein